MELNYKDLVRLKKKAKKNKLDFICSVFDEPSLNLIKKINIDAIKIASSDITDLDLIKKISKLKKPVILSTGMANYMEIKNSVSILKKNKFHLLHCISLYPCPDKLVNLNRMLNLKKKFKVKVGFSDHSIGNDACYAAITLGAKIIEKHFTDNKKLKGADHSISADPHDMLKIVKFSKKINNMTGKGNIEPSKNEKKMKKYFRKSIYYKTNIDKGFKIENDNLEIRRPFAQLNPIKKIKIIGKILKKKVKKNDPVRFKDLI